MELIKIDLKKIVASRLKGWKRHLVPDFAVGWLEHIIHQEELNGVLAYAYPKEGGEFARAVLDYFDIRLEVEGLENIPAGGRVMFVSNHPLGGLDGIALIALLQEHYGDDRVRFLVNDLLMHVTPLGKVFLPINKYGGQGRDAARAIDEVFASDAPVLVFPAGLVSRLHDDGRVADLAWQKGFIAKALKYERDIVPIHFEAQNTGRFYRLARWRKKLGIKVNLEQAMLPGEMCKARGKRFRIVIGEPWSAAELTAEGETPSRIADRLRTHIYTMS